MVEKLDKINEMYQQYQNYQDLNELILIGAVFALFVVCIIGVALFDNSDDNDSNKSNNVYLNLFTILLIIFIGFFSYNHFKQIHLKENNIVSNIKSFERTFKTTIEDNYIEETFDKTIFKVEEIRKKYVASNHTDYEILLRNKTNNKDTIVYSLNIEEFEKFKNEEELFVFKKENKLTYKVLKELNDIKDYVSKNELNFSFGMEEPFGVFFKNTSYDLVDSMNEVIFDYPTDRISGLYRGVADLYKELNRTDKTYDLEDYITINTDYELIKIQ